MGGEGGDQVERATLVVVPLAAVGRLGVRGQALGDEVVVAGGEGPLTSGPSCLSPRPRASSQAVLISTSSAARPAAQALWVATTATSARSRSRWAPHRPCLAFSFQYMARRSCTITPR